MLCIRSRNAALVSVLVLAARFVVKRKTAGVWGIEILYLVLVETILGSCPVFRTLSKIFLHCSFDFHIFF